MGTKLIIGLSVGGLLLLALGLIARFVYPLIYNNESSLADGSMVYDEWQAPDYPIYMKYYMYTYTNAQDFVDGTDPKPEVEQLGVLSYRETQVKFDLEYVDDDKRVIYYNNKSYVFDEETSTMAENDTIVVPNILLFTILATYQETLNWGFIKFFANRDFNGGDPDYVNAVSPFYMVEAGDFLWGYNDNLFLEQLHGLDAEVPTKFGLQVNNTNDGQYEIYTGKGDDNDKRGIVEKWDNLTALTFWYSDTCNMINGTDGTIFPVDVPKDERLYVFNTQICRSIFLEAEEDQEIEGIDTTKFVAPSEVFEVDFEDNVGYCTGGEKDECLGNGLLDASKCYKELIKDQTGQSLDISLIISSPEFLYCDNNTIESIIGFDPNPAEHETYLNMERTSGVILKAAKRVQVNTNIKYFNGIDSLETMEKIVDRTGQSGQYLVPLFWGEESLPVDSKLTDLVNESTRVTTAVLVLAYLFIAFGCILIVVAVALVVYSSTKKTSAYEMDKEGLLRRQF
ncbi:lysosome membrane protein 2-like [Convolutriloba macropyga]|uniref:lysosome membrane protein 2-like n=1 Tax=Convolutriloba macropyga TaxID=536237 RepID=UPI003F526A0D